MKLLNNIIRQIQNDYCVIRLDCMFTEQDFEDMLIDLISGESTKAVLYVAGKFKTSFCLEFYNRKGYIILKTFPIKSANEFNTFRYLLDIEENKILYF